MERTECLASQSAAPRTMFSSTPWCMVSQAQVTTPTLPSLMFLQSTPPSSASMNLTSMNRKRIVEIGSNLFEKAGEGQIDIQEAIAIILMYLEDEDETN